MASRTKYISPSNPDSFVYLTWKSGYGNVKLFQNGKLIASTQASEIKKGYHIINEKLDKIELSFSTEGLNVKINSEDYTPSNHKTNLERLKSGASIVAIILSVTIILMLAIGGFWLIFFALAPLLLLIYYLTLYIALRILTKKYTKNRKLFLIFLGLILFPIAWMIIDLNGFFHFLMKVEIFI